VSGEGEVGMGRRLDSRVQSGVSTMDWTGKWGVETREAISYGDADQYPNSKSESGDTVYHKNPLYHIAKA
jgi:hypothetical protein